MSYDAIEIAQTDVAARLRSLDYFSDIYIGAPRVWKDGDKVNSPKTITDQIDKALNGLVATGDKTGASIRIFQPTFRVPKTNLPGPQGMFTILCRCEAHPILNFSVKGTNKFVSAIGFQVLRSLHNFSLNGIVGTLFADGDCFVPYFSEDRKMMTADVLLQSRCKLAPEDQAGMPVISIDAGNNVTLAETTGGSEIYYSTEVSIFPAEHVAGAILYNGSFNAASGTAIRWAAYRKGLAGSYVGYQLIP